MVKKIVLFVAIFIATLSLKAQISVGFEDGLNISTVKSSLIPANELDFRTGYFIGVIPQYRFNEKMAVNLATQYSVEGFDFHDPFSEKFRLHYLRFNPQLEYKPIKFLGLYSGVSFGIKTGEYLKVDNTGWTQIKGLNIMKRTDFGMVIGAKAYANKFFFTVGYYQSLQNTSNLIFETEINGTFTGNVKHRNRNIQIGIGYTL